MSSIAAPAALRRRSEVSELAHATSALAARATRSMFRRPQYLAPLVIFPSVLLAANSGGLNASTHLPGFPAVHGFFDFQIAAAICQSLLLGGVQAGIAVALEIEGGFFDRLVTAPIPRAAIVLGRLAAVALLSVLQAVFFLAVALIFGAHIVAGVPGAMIVLLISAVAGVAFGGIGIVLALRTRNASIVQGIFPLIFVILFLSTAFFPQALLSAPADTVARLNPLSYIADALRNPIIAEISARRVLEGLAAAGGLAALMIGLAIHSLRGRLAA